PLILKFLPKYVVSFFDAAGSGGCGLFSFFFLPNNGIKLLLFGLILLEADVSIQIIIYQKAKNQQLVFAKFSFFCALTTSFFYGINRKFLVGAAYEKNHLRFCFSLFFHFRQLCRQRFGFF
ncbi:MAG: hypothetical protein PVF26_08755, partial [Desulfobacterales bacterium]